MINLTYILKRVSDGELDPKDAELEINSYVKTSSERAERLTRYAEDAVNNGIELKDQLESKINDLEEVNLHISKALGRVSKFII